MYDLENIQSNPNSTLRKINAMPVFRTLLDAPATNATLTNATANNSTLTNSTKAPIILPIKPKALPLQAYVAEAGEIHINGNGVAGIAVTILFLIPVFIGSFALMSIFVNTKILDTPLRIKIMD
jgi:hypothetical protein